jgi:hypothetical protein
VLGVVSGISSVRGLVMRSNVRTGELILLSLDKGRSSMMHLVMMLLLLLLVLLLLLLVLLLLLLLLLGMMRSMSIMAAGIALLGLGM